MSTTLDPGAGFGEYLISARSFVEDTAMLALISDDLRGSVLDCPGGGASFTAAACARGVEAMAIDPAHAMTPEDLSNRLARGLERGAIWARERSDAYAWDVYGGPTGHATVRTVLRCRLRRASRAMRARGAPAPAAGRRRRQPGVVPAPALHRRRSPRPRLPSGSAAGDGRCRARSGACASARRSAGRLLDELVTALVQDLESGGLRASVRAIDDGFQLGARHMLVIDPPDLEQRSTARGSDGRL